MNRSVKLITVPVALVGAGITLAACSSGAASTSATPAKSSSSASPSSSASGRAGGAGARFDTPAVQACLKAAGITVPTGFARPSGTGTFTRPTGSRTGTRPSGAPRSGGGGFGGNSAQQQQIQAALKACGITLPSRTAPAGTAAPTASPSS